VKKALEIKGRVFHELCKPTRSNRISLIDGATMLTMIERLPADAKQQLLEFATQGDYTTPTCPSCGIPMRHVNGKAGRPDFWGGHNYPRCRQVLGMKGGIYG